MKRGVDLVLSSLLLFILSPVFLLLIILIKLDSPGPVFFRQVRITSYGRPFRIFKFRTMVCDAPERGPSITVAQDPRITKAGKILRRFHLDELCQLLNVFQGDMSFVGPRPERKYFVDKIMAINPDYELLYQLRPGLFSEATLYNGYTDTMEKMLKRLRMDLDYYYNRSLWIDTKIIFLTIFSILSGKKF